MHKEISVQLLSNSCQNKEFDTFVLLLKNDRLKKIEDFLYYGSENRNLPFDSGVYKNKACWKNVTCPMSLDGSVLIENDSCSTDYFDSSDNYEILSEECIINLAKIDLRYNKIIIGYSLYNGCFGDIEQLKVRVLYKSTQQMLKEYIINIDNVLNSAVDGVVLSRDEKSSWILSAGTKTYNDGLSGVLDTYYEDME